MKHLITIGQFGKICVLLIILNHNTLPAQEPKLVLPVGHVSPVTSADFSKDGKYAFTFSIADGTIKTWDAYTGLLLEENTLRDLKGTIAAQYSRPEDIIFNKQTGKDGIIKTRIFNTRLNKQVSVINADLKDLKIFAFSADTAFLITGFYNGETKLWDTHSGKLLRKLENCKSLNSAAFFDSGKKILTCLLSTSARIIETSSGNVLKTLDSYYDTGIFNPDSTRIFLFSNNDYFSVKTLYDVKLNKVLTHEAEPDFYNIRSASFSTDGKYVAVTCSDSTVRFLDENNKIIKQIKGHDGQINSAVFHPSDKMVLTSSDNGTAQIWDFKSSNILHFLKGHTAAIIAGSRSDDKWLIAYNNKQIRSFDNNTGRLTVKSDFDTLDANVWFNADCTITTAQNGGLNLSIKDIEKKKPDVFITNDYSIEPGGLSFDKKLLLTYSKSGEILLWDALTGKSLKKFSLKAAKFNHINMAAFHPDGKMVVAAAATGLRTNKLLAWSTITGELLFSRTIKNSDLENIKFNSNGSKIAYLLHNVNTDQSVVEIRDFKNNVLLAKKEYGRSLIDFVGFSPDGKVILITTSEGNIKLWDAGMNHVLAQLYMGANTHLLSVNFDSGKIMAARESELLFFDLKTNKEVCKTIAIDSSDYITILPSGYYMATPTAAKLLHYITNGLKVVTFEQLDVKYNRPDLVLQAIGSTDTILINSYKKAYEKRTKKLGIDTSAFKSGYNVPEADFKNREVIAFEQTKDKLSLHIIGSDNAINLERFNIWVNEVPVFGMRGINLKKMNTKHLDTVVTIILSQGDNNIETSVTNSNGIESYRMPLSVKYISEKQLNPKVYFIGMGINKFAEAGRNLNYSVKDIRDLADQLKQKYSAELITDTLFDEKLTKPNVRSLKAIFEHAGVNDKIIVAYSGHGLLSDSLDYYLSTYNINFKKPEQNGLPYDLLEDLLDSIAPRQKLMLIDACHSGEVDKDEKDQMQASTMTLAATNVTFSRGIDFGDAPKLGLQNSFELMRALFLNVGKGTGATIISAAGGAEFALERGELGNGVFTWSILKAMEDYKSLKVSELKEIVSEQVEKITGGLQKPTSRNETLNYDWNVW